ncbi:MAG: AMP-binding protein, partial [Spirochaetes bacterium]|nr:AMP-binding protein [Spirochaetota bacterium]
EYISNHSKIKFIFTSKKYLDNVKEIFKEVRSLKKIICMDDVPEERNVIPFNKFIKIGSSYKFPLLHKVRPSDLLAILYTSGTTGTAKGVMLTQKNVISDVELGAQMILFDDTDTFLSVLPIHHSFEGTGGFILPLYGGASITYAESLKSRNILDNIKETNVTLMLGVPLLYEKLYMGILKAVKEKPLPIKLIFKASMGVVKMVRKVAKKKIGRGVFKSLRAKAGLSAMKYFISGGGPLRPDVARGFDNLGLTIVQGYGLTETSPIVTVSTIEYNNYYSVGLPLPDVDIKIHDQDEKGIGEILLKGPMLMKGYYKNRKATREVIKKGWLHTGDLGYIDKTGFVYITGRKKNLIVTQGGKNVFPEELEKKLDASHFILESMVYGQPVSEKDRGEKVFAIIVPDYEAIDEHGRHTGMKFNSEDKIEHLISHEVKKLNSKLATYKKLSGFKIHSEELTKTSTRKIKRYLYLEKLIQVNGKRKR